MIRPIKRLIQWASVGPLACALFGCGPAARVDRPLSRDNHPADFEVDRKFMDKVAKDPFPSAHQQGLAGS